MLAVQIASGSAGVIVEVRECKSDVTVLEMSVSDGALKTRKGIVTDPLTEEVVLKVMRDTASLEEIHNVVVLLKRILFSSSRMTLEERMDMIDYHSPFHLNRLRKVVTISIQDHLVLRRMDGSLRDFYHGHAGCKAPSRGGGVSDALDAVLGSLALLRMMHEHGTFHCDIKDDNILFCEKTPDKATRFVLSDFGHTRTLYHSHFWSSGTNSTIGTPGSRSPFLYASTQEDMEIFVEDNIVTKHVARPEDIWQDYETIRVQTGRRDQMTKNDIYGIGVILARICDQDVRELSRACLFATPARSALWSVSGVIEWAERIRNAKKGTQNPPLILDVRMRGGGPPPKRSKGVRKQISLL